MYVVLPLDGNDTVCLTDRFWVTEFVDTTPQHAGMLIPSRFKQLTLSFPSRRMYLFVTETMTKPDNRNMKAKRPVCVL